MSEFKSIKAIIHRKSHLFGLYQPITHIYFDTKGYYSHPQEARLTSGWKIQGNGYFQLQFSIINPTSKLNLVAYMFVNDNGTTSDNINVLGSTEIGYIYIHRTYNKSYDISYRPDILDLNDIMDIAHQLIIIHNRPI